MKIEKKNETVLLILCAIKPTIHLDCFFFMVEAIKNQKSEESITLLVLSNQRVPRKWKKR